MKKIIFTLVLVISLFAISGCATKESKAFKEDYEKLNGTKNKAGKEHRSISITEDNPFIEVSADEIVSKIDNKETFYVYFGSSLCPWCRSVIESANKIAKEKNIKTIYYVDVWDEDGKEILRDKYEYKDNNLVKTINGTDSYYKLLDNFNDLLRDYVVDDPNVDDKKISTGEKRIYAPNFVYIKDGKAVKLITGKSNKLIDPRDELTDEIKHDEEESFRDFFNN